MLRADVRQWGLATMKAERPDLTVFSAKLYHLTYSILTALMHQWPHLGSSVQTWSNSICSVELL